MIRVLIVDDSVAVRGLLRKAISEIPDLEVVGAASDGILAINEYERLRPDVVIMDVEMPEMNGIEALRAILKIDNTARVMMCSSLTDRNSQITMQALELGAVDVLQKPSADKFFSEPDAFTQELIRKIKAIAPEHRALAQNELSDDAAGMAADMTRPSEQESCTLQPLPPDFRRADIICIGSSTGGVQALQQVLTDIGVPNVPILVTQHMPPTFTHMLALQITQKTGLNAVEAQEGMKIEANTVYIAPGGLHMEIVNENDEWRVHLSDGPMENFCRPSVDPMVRTLLRSITRQKVLLIILTGMGNDGQNAGRMIVEQGHVLVAQDEATSVVWGMPGAVAKEGLCHAILPVGEIGHWVRNYLR